MISLRLEEGRTAYSPGETLRGYVSWGVLAPQRALEVRLFWHTSGKGTRDVGIASVHRVGSPDLRGTDRPFRFVLPRAPWSFAGNLVRLAWGVEAVLLPGEEAAAIGIIVAPEGTEARLPGPARVEAARRRA